MGNESIWRSFMENTIWACGVMLLIGAAAVGQATQPGGVGAVEVLRDELTSALRDPSADDGAVRAVAAAAGVVAEGEGISPEASLEARQVQLRAFHSLVMRSFTRGDPAEAGLRLTQLRGAAERTRRARTPDARAVAGYWLLIADLIEGGDGLDVVERLRAFVDELREEEATPLVASIRVAMGVAWVRAAAEQGMVEEACGEYAELLELVQANDPRLTPLADVAAGCGEMEEVSGEQ